MPTRSTTSATRVAFPRSLSPAASLIETRSIGCSRKQKQRRSSSDGIRSGSKRDGNNTPRLYSTRLFAAVGRMPWTAHSAARLLGSRAVILIEEVRVVIRDAQESDLPQIVEIVNAFLTTTTTEWTEHPIVWRIGAPGLRGTGRLVSR